MTLPITHDDLTEEQLEKMLQDCIARRRRKILRIKNDRFWMWKDVAKALPEGEEPKKKKGHPMSPKQKDKTSRQAKKNNEGDPELLRMGEKLDEMGELGSSVEEMHLAIGQFLEGQREWTDSKKEAVRKWLLTKVTRIDSTRHR